MLLEFRCSNFKSIKEEIRFSMIAGKDDTSEELFEYSAVAEPPNLMK